MLIEINGVNGQYALVNPEHVVRTAVRPGRRGWLAAVTMAGSPNGPESADTVFGPFEDKADADACVRRVAEAANAAQTVERRSEFVEFTNRYMTRAAVRRESILGVQIVPPADYFVWVVKVDVGGEPIFSQGFDTSSEADELFDRLTR